MSRAFSFDQEVGLFLATCRTLSLSTCDASLRPHAANVQYVSDETWSLYWVSKDESLHSRQVAENPHAAGTIYGHDDKAEKIHGLQLRGTVEAITDKGEWNRVWELYTGKFTFIRSMPAMQKAVVEQTFYRFTPTWLRWIDNRRAFGFKVEKELGA